MRKEITNFSGGISSKIDENLLRWKNAKTTYNFQFFDGALKRNIAFSGLKGAFGTSLGLGDNSLVGKNTFYNGRVFYFQKCDELGQNRADKLLLLDDNFNLYSVSLYAQNPSFESLNFTFTSLPSAVCYRLNSADVILFSSPTDGLVMWDGENDVQKIESAPSLSSLTFHYERLFGISAQNPYELWFSDDFDPTNWTIDSSSAGFIQMLDDRGELKKVISYNDYLYILREHGISRLSGAGAQESFYLSHMFVSSGRIYENTAQVCGDKILFMSSAGLCLFDGVSVTPIVRDLASVISVNEDSSSAYYDGKYYLSCKIDFGDVVFNDGSHTNNALLILDAETMEYQIVRGVSVSSMARIFSPDKDTLVFLSERAQERLFIPTTITDSGAFGPLTSSWKTGQSDLGLVKKQKVIRKLGAVVTHGNFNIILRNQNNESVSVNIESGLTELPVRLAGETFSLEIRAKANSVSDKNVITSVWVDVV